MVKKALMLLGVLAIVGVAGLSLLLPDAVSASGHSATRSFGTNTVLTGAELEIEISVSGLSAFGQVQETLPEGFAFVRSAQASTVDGQTLTFTILGNDETFRYTVTAPSAAGTYEFSGTVSDSNKDSRDVGGDSSIEVADQPFGAERSISRSSVNTGDQVTISIDASGFDTAASVVENLPAGFSYMSSNLSSAAVNAGEDSLRFTLLGEDSFSYTLTAGDPGDYTFSGTITGFDKVAADITGDDSVTVNPPAPATAVRSFPAEFVDPGSEVVVTIVATGYGPAGQVEETIPDGFAYMSTSVPGGASEVSGQTFVVTLLGEDSFTYTVTAPAETGSYTFSGSLRDIDKNETDIGGVSDFIVGAPPAFPDSESGARSIPENTDAGVDIGDAIAAESAVGALTYGIAGDDAADFDIVVATGQLKTKSALDYETKASYILSITATDEFGRSASLDLTVEITDVGEAPVFPDTEGVVRAVPENTAAGVTIGGPIAAESTTGPLTYEITSAAADTFDIDAATGQLITKGALDFETKASYILSITATDEFGRSASLDVTVQVTNVYEGIMITDSGVREINENTPFGVRIGDPIDATSGEGSSLTFAITSAAADTFDIEPDTGQLRTKGDLDFETRASYSLQVTITDEFGESESLVITIRVLDRDEYVPPTATPVPTATSVPPTATAVPPTATSVPPTATAVPPTATSIPATATPTPVVEVDEGGFPVWAIIVIVLAVIAGVAIIGFVIYRRRQT